MEIPSSKQDPDHMGIFSGECETPYPESMDFRETTSNYFEQANDTVSTDSAAANVPSVTESVLEDNGITSDLSDISSSFGDKEIPPYKSRSRQSAIKSEPLTGHGFTKDNGIDNDIKCPYCSIALPTMRKLSLHCKIEHRKNKLYKCTYCKHSFKSVTHLIRHLRTHTGEKPFSCCTCPYRSSTKGAMVAHVRTHTNERPYKCSKCKFSTKTAKDLTYHLRVHTNERPYKCQQCDWAFKLQTHLIAHMKTHTNERPHQCSVCDYSARDKASLVKHMRVHTMEKPFQCDRCYSSFTQRSSLRTHKASGVCRQMTKIYLFSQRCNVR
ncbi:hypothetical protein RRG08_056949 [Elysia crispata]|nr:hypothetical protein RRG08_056949 [Elysia crispata]